MEREKAMTVREMLAEIKRLVSKGYVTYDSKVMIDSTISNSAVVIHAPNGEVWIESGREKDWGED